jgi:hypothetical protein
MLKTCLTLSKLDNKAAANNCKVVSKDTNQSVAELTMTRLKLLCFWIKHQYHTSQEIGTTSKPLVRVKPETISLMKNQKRDEDVWASENKEPEYTPLTLDTASAMKVFNKVKNLLTCVHGVMGIPFLYVIRILLIPKDKDDAPPFGEEDTKYTSVDMETTAHTPILSDDANYDQEYNALETHGPFVPSFLTDTKKIWSILLACFSLSSMWQHIKKFSAQQNGRQAWCILHNHFFGRDKVNTMYSDILLTLKNLHYSCNRKNFNFDKYCTAHVEQHNCHATLAEYGVTPLEKTMKIHYFEDGISDSSFASVKSMIMVDCQKFQEFDALMHLYMNFKCLQKAEAPTYQACNVSALQGHGGGRQGHGGCGGGGCGGPNSCVLGLVPQEVVDKVTTVENRYYPAFEYNKLTPAKKAKHYQIKDPGRSLGLDSQAEGPTRPTRAQPLWQS